MGLREDTMNAFDKLQALLQSLPFLSGVLISDSTRKKVIIGVLVALVPGAVWGMVAGVVQFYVFQGRVENRQGSMRKDLNELEEQIRTDQRINARKRAEIRRKAERVDERVRDMQTDIRVIRHIVEEDGK